jgi:ketosteroid isomerase-like protein
MEKIMITSHAKRICTRCILLVAGLIVATAPAHAASIRAAIEAQNAKFSAAASKADGGGFSALHTADAQVLPAGRDAVKGTEELRTFWQGVLDSGVAGVSLKTLEVYAQGTRHGGR